jgi:uncharacterized protein YbjQ (UPF0145 family)
LCGRSGAYEKELRKARNLAFEEITEAAQELGANAILGVDIDYEVLARRMGCSWSVSAGQLLLSNKTLAYDPSLRL